MFIGISGFGHYLPVNEISNEQLIEHYGMDVSAEWVFEKTGIRKRCFVSENETNSDLGANAARMAVEDAGLTLSEIDALVLTTSSPDYLQPPTACIVHGKLGLTKAFAFDVMGVCSGFVFALSVAYGLMKANEKMNHTVVVASETYSRIVNFADAKSSILFGDGAGAVVLSRCAGIGEIKGFHLCSEGDQHERIMVRSGGVADRITAQAVANGRHLFAMDGKAVSDFVVRVFGEAQKYFHFDSRPTIDVLVPHQANAALLHHAAIHNNIPLARILIDMENTGNTSAASIPITLSRAWRLGTIRRGMKVGLFGFGGGLSYGMVELTL